MGAGINLWRCTNCSSSVNQHIYNFSINFIRQLTNGLLSKTISKVETALSQLQGDGNRYGYVDSSTLTSFSEVSHSMPDVRRCTATITLNTRPQ